MQRWLVFLGTVMLSSCLPRGSRNAYEPRGEVSKAARPPLMSHDFGYGKEPKVHANRLFFHLTFEEPIALNGDEKIEVIAKDGQNPQMGDVKFSEDGACVRLELKPQKEGPLVPEQKYAVVIRRENGTFDELLDFMAIEPAPVFAENMPPKISSFSHSVEIKWSLNNAHEARFRFGTDPAELDCGREICPEALSLAKDKKVWSLQNLSLLHVGGLQSETAYYFSLEASDRQGQNLVVKGNFVTERPSPLRFSKLMIKPSVPDGMAEHRGEFLELKNSGDEPFDLSGLALGLEGLWEGQDKKCRLEFAAERPAIDAGSHIWIVGSEFDPALYELSAAAPTLRLRTKTLCGGLANSYPQRLKLYGPNGGLLDGYGAHLWPVEPGVAVARIEAAGLDEPENYCYLAPGASPGVAWGTGRIENGGS